MKVPPAGARFLLAATVKVFEKETLVLDWEEGVSLTVKFTKFNVPELAMLQPVELAVTVPDEGGNLLAEAIVKALLNEKSPVG